MGLFGAGQGWGGWGKKAPNLLKPAVHITQWQKLVQLYLSWIRLKKYVNHVTGILSMADDSVFKRKSGIFDALG